MPGLGLPLYRALLKECRQLGQTLETLQIRQMVQGEWGRHSMGRIGVPQEELSVDLVHMMEASEALEALVPGLGELPPSVPITIPQLKSLIRRNFDMHRAANDVLSSSYTALDQGFAALRALPYQGYLQRCSSSALTHNMLVEATAAALPARPMHQGNPMYPFSYRVRVTNLSAMWVQLLGREWVFKDGAGGLVSAVPLQRDNAVVGQQPRLPPGGYFAWTSGVPLTTPSGSMCGRLVLDVLMGPASQYQAVGEIVVPIADIKLQQPGPGGTPGD